MSRSSRVTVDACVDMQVFLKNLYCLVLHLPAKKSRPMAPKNSNFFMVNHKLRLLSEETSVWWRNNQNCHASRTPLSKLCQRGFPSVADLDQSSLHTNWLSANQTKPSTMQLSYLALFDWFLKLDEVSTHHAVVCLKIRRKLWLYTVIMETVNRVDR